MFVRLKLEDTREVLVATISQRGDDGKITGRPSIFFGWGQGRYETKSKGGSAGFGVENLGVVDKTSSRIPPPIRSA
jgi:hypothetical protein